ncbi:hypothetical protein WSS15_11460 [Acetobacter pasteurianus]|uniref:hypothetical protein n=1 Tax=Acetobacter pasteurianus TaxID=438 RepID=UPI0022C00693|nr:hypothetical protein [Acetobacter pasteurianus]GLH28496.1 hypothetical protein WSS15_11460 [Acetobacter pasteurianus]
MLSNDIQVAIEAVLCVLILLGLFGSRRIKKSLLTLKEIQPSVEALITQLDASASSANTSVNTLKDEVAKNGRKLTFLIQDSSNKIEDLTSLNEGASQIMNELRGLSDSGLSITSKLGDQIVRAENIRKELSEEILRGEEASPLLLTPDMQDQSPASTLQINDDHNTEDTIPPLPAPAPAPTSHVVNHLEQRTVSVQPSDMPLPPNKPDEGKVEDDLIPSGSNSKAMSDLIDQDLNEGEIVVSPDKSLAADSFINTPSTSQEVQNTIGIGTPDLPGAMADEINKDKENDLQEPLITEHQTRPKGPETKFLDKIQIPVPEIMKKPRPYSSPR